MPLTVRQVFDLEGLIPSTPVLWKTPLTETQCGVYVVALTPDPDSVAFKPVSIDHLTPGERRKWNVEEPVIYIGMTTRPLQERLGEFYRHVYGEHSPHRGGQATHLLNCDLWVFWSPAEEALTKEKAMIREFKRVIGRYPYANRRA